MSTLLLHPLLKESSRYDETLTHIVQHSKDQVTSTVIKQSAKTGRLDAWFKKLFSPNDPEQYPGVLSAFIEVFCGTLYQVILGANHAPKTRMGINKDTGELYRIIYSKGIRNFSCAFDKLCSGEISSLVGPPNLQDIVTLCMAIAFLAENDMHSHNWGFADTGVIKIDHNKSLFPFVLFCLMIRKALEGEVGAIYDRIRERNFSVFTKLLQVYSENDSTFPMPVENLREDIALLPLSFKHMSPHNGIHHNAILYSAIAAVFNDPTNQNLVEQAKYTALQKIVLIPDSLISKIGDISIDRHQAHEKEIRLFAQQVVIYVKTRKNRFREAMTGMPEFHAFFKQNAYSALKQILNDFENYNRMLKSDRETLSIQTSDVLQEFNRLYLTMCPHVDLPMMSHTSTTLTLSTCNLLLLLWNLNLFVDEQKAHLELSHSKHKKLVFISLQEKIQRCSFTLPFLSAEDQLHTLQNIVRDIYVVSAHNRRKASSLLFKIPRSLKAWDTLCNELEPLFKESGIRPYHESSLNKKQLSLEYSTLRSKT